MACNQSSDGYVFFDRKEDAGYMERRRKIVQISIIGIAVNLILVLFKGAVGLLTGSVAIIMDAVNNLSDALSSVITIVGTKLAGKAPDKKHPYGYGQIEYISSVTIAIIILIAGLASFRESFAKILHPEAANYTLPSLVIIAVAVAVKFLLGRYVKGEGKKLKSESLLASGTDAVFDSVISLSTLVAAVVSMLWHISIEGYLGVVIVVIIWKSGIEILMDSLSGLIGARVDSELSVNLKKRLCEYPGVLGAYDLTLHRYGPEKIIGSAHIELPDDMTAREIHSLTRKIIEDVYLNYSIILTVGIYASNTTDGIFAEMKDRLSALTAADPSILQMHGFYADTEKMLVSFDLIIDFKSERKSEIRDNLIGQMKQFYPEYDFTVILDSDFSD